MKKLLLLFTFCNFLFIGTSCTENQKARRFGGNMTINVPAGMKVTMATWKQDDLFYMLEPMEKTYIPKTKKFVEDSSFGVFETEVTFIEKR